ncbi:MAG: CRTAC1 family protein [Candidatus Omnitrophica bacterium]|nr:CRTAC1 family protein [Candidatus Omnitrophota bacterium]
MALANPAASIAFPIAGGPLSPPTPETEVSADQKILADKVTPVPSKVEFDAISDVIINAGNTVLLELKAHSNAGHEVSFTAADLPDGAELTGNKFQWAAGPGVQGEYKLIFKATDGSESAEQSVSFYFVPTPGSSSSNAARPMILPDQRPSDGTAANSKNFVIVIPTGSSGTGSSGSTSPLKDTKSGNLKESGFRADEAATGGNDGNVALAPGTEAYGFGGPGLFFPDDSNDSNNSGGNDNSNSSDGSGGGGDNSGDAGSGSGGDDTGDDDGDDDILPNPEPTTDTIVPVFLASDPVSGSEVNSLAQVRFFFFDNIDLDENATASTLSVTQDGTLFPSSSYSKNSSAANQVSVSIANVSTERHVYRFRMTPVDTAGNRGTQADITITDLADRADVHNTFQDVTFLIQPVYVFGRAAAFADYNNDNFEDLYVINPHRQDANHFGLPAAYVGENMLLKQLADRTFVDEGNPFDKNAWMPGHVGSTPNAASQPQSIAFGDIDNDGFRDFFITNSSGPNVLKRAVPDEDRTFLKFEDENAQLEGGTDIGDSRGAIFADFNGDGYVDIYVANGVNNNVLYVNRRGDPGNPPNPNSFANMAAQAGVEAAGKNCLSAIAFDADNDGDSDLYLLYLHSPNELYVNDSTTFTPHFTLAAGVMNHSGHSTAAQAGDLDNDGFADVFVCDLEGNSKLYRNTTVSTNNPTFQDVTAPAAVNTVLAATQSRNRRVNGAAFVDFDNDSDLDIFLLRANDHNVLLNNPLDPPQAASVVLGNRAFTDATSSELVAFPNLSESAATGDFNDDGKKDIFVTASPSALSESVLYQNVSQNQNHFLKIKLQQSPLAGDTGPRDSTGAMVIVEARGETGSPLAGSIARQTQQVLGGNGRGQDSSVLHFGITNAIQPGDMSSAELDITVFWPNSSRSTFLSSTLGDFVIDSTVTVTENTNTPNPFFIGITESGVDRNAAIDTEFFFILQVDDPDPAVDEQSLRVTVSDNVGTSIGNGNLTQLTGEQLGKWLFRFNVNQPGFSVGQEITLDFRVTNPATRRFSDAALRIHVVSQAGANAVPVIDGIPAGEVKLDLAVTNSEMIVPLIVTDSDSILASDPPLALSVNLALQNGNLRPGTSQIELLGSGSVILSNDGKQIIQSIRWQPDPGDLVLGQEATGAVYTVSVTVDDFVAGDARTPFTKTFNVRVSNRSASNPVPTALILSPADNSTINTSDILVTFDTPDWTVGGKGGTHIHFHLDNVPGYSFNDPFMFYNGSDRIVEFNLESGQTNHATWATINSLVFHNVPDGLHRLKAHLADEFHNDLQNSEASMIVTFDVAAGPRWNENQPSNGTAVVGRPIEINLADAITSPGLHALNFSLHEVKDPSGQDAIRFLDGKYSINGNGLFTYTPGIEEVEAGPALTFFFAVEDGINPIQISGGTVITIQHELAWNMPLPQSADVGGLYIIQLNHGDEITYTGLTADLVVTLESSTANDPDSYVFDQNTDTLFYRPNPNDYAANVSSGTPVNFSFRVTDGVTSPVTAGGTLTIAALTDISGKYGMVFENLNGFTFDANQVFEHAVGADPLRPGMEKWKLELHSDGASIDNGAGHSLVGFGDVTGKELAFDIRVAEALTGVPILIGLKDTSLNEVNNINIETHQAVVIEGIVTGDPESLRSDKYVRVRIDTSAFAGVDLANLENWTIRIPDQGAGAVFTLFLDNMRFE